MLMLCYYGQDRLHNIPHVNEWLPSPREAACIHKSNLGIYALFTSVEDTKSMAHNQVIWGEVGWVAPLGPEQVHMMAV